MNHTYKVDHRMIENAKTLRIKGRTQEEIAVELGVSQSTISIILRAVGLGGKLMRKSAPLTLLRRSVAEVS